MSKINEFENTFSKETLENLKQSLPIFEKMLEDRKYIPLYTTKIYFPKVNIIERMNRRIYETPSGKLALVIIVSCTGDIKIYNDYIYNKEYETIICIYTNNINVSHRRIEKTFKYKIEIWPLIYVHIADHILKPIIEVIDKDKAEEFKYGRIHPSKLPKISYYDPLIRYYRIFHKSIIKITDKDTLIPSYRIVVK